MRSKLTSLTLTSNCRKENLKNTFSCRNIFQIFLNFWHDLNKWLFYVFASEVWLQHHPAIPPFLLSLMKLLGGGLQSGVALVRTPISFRSWAMVSVGDGGFLVRPMLWLFLSGLLMPHRSGEIPETGSLCSMVTHYTHYTLHGPGSFNLDLIGLSLLAKKWGPTLTLLVRDMPRGSRFF